MRNLGQIRPLLKSNLLVVGNRDSFKVTTKVIGVYYEREAEDSQRSPGDLDDHILLGAGLCGSYSITGPQLLLESSSTTLPCPPSTSSLGFRLGVECFTFWRPIFSIPASSIPWLQSFCGIAHSLCILPFHFPRENLIGLPNYQSLV